MVSFSKLNLAPAAVAALLASVTSVTAASGSGVTTRYWDCCKPSCAWSGKASVSAPVRTCDKNQNYISDLNAVSGCTSGGTSFTCANNQPWAVSSTLAYGFAAVSIAGGTESSWCCQCYALTFPSTSALSGKTFIVQATNTGGDLGSNQFDLLIPGGGVGIYNGCPSQYGSWNGGAQYGGVSSESQCANLPSIVQAGCDWRWDWFGGADNPAVNWQTVACPTAITDKSGCIRSDQSGNGNTIGQGGATSSSSSRTSTSSRTTSTSTHTTSTSSANGSGQTLYGQCGGTGWSGPTTCASGTCKVSNQWYSQCLP